MKNWSFYPFIFNASIFLCTIRPGKINKKAVALFTQAMERIDDGSLTNAAGLLQQAIETDKIM